MCYSSFLALYCLPVFWNPKYGGWTESDPPVFVFGAKPFFQTLLLTHLVGGVWCFFDTLWYKNSSEKKKESEKCKTYFSLGSSTLWDRSKSVVEGMQKTSLDLFRCKGICTPKRLNMKSEAGVLWRYASWKCLKSRNCGINSSWWKCWI